MNIQDMRAITWAVRLALTFKKHGKHKVVFQLKKTKRGFIFGWLVGNKSSSKPFDPQEEPWGSLAELMVGPACFREGEDMKRTFLAQLKQFAASATTGQTITFKFDGTTTLD